VARSAPVVYLLHGEDEFGIARFITAMVEKLGDPSTAEMNTARFDARSLNFDELTNAASAVPFLAGRRLVILHDPSSLRAGNQQEKLAALLDFLPQTTAFVLAEGKSLPKNHWLLKWAKSAGERVYVKEFEALKGGRLAAWIRSETSARGGEINPQAAALLAEIVVDEPRMVSHEIDKLLAYANYARPIDVEDVDHLAAFAGGQGDFFALIDAVGAGNGRKALEHVHRLQEQQEPLSLFFSLVNNFRLMLLVREVLDAGGDKNTVAKELGLHPYRAEKLTGHARKFSMAALEAIHRRLLDYDVEIKTGQLPAELALDMLVTTLTAQAA
jgi:DNA polymerase-3 subunit delta